jgi:hypothetical protein
MAALAYAPRGGAVRTRRTRRTAVGALDASTTLRLVAVPANRERGVAVPPVAFRPVIVEPVRIPPFEKGTGYAPSLPSQSPKISRELERRVVERRAAERRARAAKLRRRRLRLLGALVCVGLAAVLWFGTSAIASQGRLQVLPGSVKTVHGYLYRVRPGDTVWSIATRLDPSGDPRALAGEIESEIGGTDLQAGTQVLVP